MTHPAVRLGTPATSALALALVLAIALPAAPVAAQAQPSLAGLLEKVEYRALGPYRAGSWVTAIAVPELPAREHLYTMYVGTRNGGVWKTTNNGTTFQPVFDGQRRLSIGDVAVAPSDSNIVWVGTGEAYCARSSTSGDGVYKSADAGRTWANMGLPESHHIARIMIHPKNPDIVYVAAMGYLFSDNPERGVFKTADGGKTWRKVLFVSDKVGAVDLMIVNADPNVLYAAMYDKIRRPWEYISGGPESAIYKSVDGGETWKRLGGGLPSGLIGRIGLDVYHKDPNIVVAVVENVNPRQPTPQELEQDKRRGTSLPQPRTMGNEVYRSDDAGETWRKVNAGYEAALDKAPYSFNMLRLDQHDPDTIYITGQSLFSTVDGGKTWRGVSWPSNGVFREAFGDWRTMWIDAQDRDRLIFGSDGGVYVSYDRGQTCHHHYNIPLGEFYAVGVDMEEPYNIYGGMQDHDSWKGPSNGWAGRISSSDWVTVGGGDGMYQCIDPTDSRWLYNNREMGAMWRLDQKLGVQVSIRPQRSGGEALRFNWTPPIALSPHNPAIVYTGAQVLFRSFDRGDHWQEISPDLTTNDKSKQSGLGYVPYCTLTTISESPLKAGVIWTGSDDGKVQITLNGGATWLDRTPKLAAAGAPANFWASRVFASPHDAGTAFVTKTGFRLDDYRPMILKTTDYGETWTSLNANLPADASLHVVVQDLKNPDLLFAGAEWGVYVSIDGGRSWAPMMGNMPWAKVSDLLIHPRENDLVVGTYGRGIYVTDVSPLQELNASVLASEAHLFDVEPATQRVTGGIGNYHLLGDSHLFTPNEPNAVVINYYLKSKAAGPVKITVADPYGTVLQTLEGPGEPGLNKAFWPMRIVREGEGQRAMMGRMGGGTPAEPGEYVVTVETGGAKLSKKAVIRGRQGWTVGPVPMKIK